MLELLVGLLNPDDPDRDVSAVVCPFVEQTTLEDFHKALQAENGERFDLFYGIQDGYQIISLERHRPADIYTDELRLLVSEADQSCTAHVFHRTL